MAEYVFGIDVGGTTVKMGFFQADGELVDKWEIPTRTENNGENILKDIADAALKKLADKNIDKSLVKGIGIGVPGPVADDGTVYKAVNLGWGVFNIADELSKLTGLTVKAGNDANVAALGEAFKGAGKGCHSSVMVTLGTGIGGGIIINDKIISGFMGAGGEIGHIHVMDGEGEVCGCGNRGCLEQYGSATGIVRLANRRLSRDLKYSVLRDGEISAKAVFDAVKAGDEVAIEIAEHFGEILGKGLAAIACVVNPEAFIIGGGVSKAGEVVIDYIKEPFLENVFHGSRGTKFLLATLGNDAGIYGAARLAIGD